MSLLSRAFGVHPYRTHTVRVQRDLVIPAGDGVPLANRSYPADIHKPRWCCSAARTAAAWRWTGCRICWPNVATRCCTKACVELAAPAACSTASPLTRPMVMACSRGCASSRGLVACWPRGEPVTWVSPRELASRDIPEWKVAVIQDAPSEFAHQFMYPGGGFALGNALGWVQIVDRMFRAGGGTARQFLSLLTAPRSMRRAVATLPVAEADIALTGHRVRWFQEWIHHGPDDPYWQATDHRGNVDRMPPVIYLQGGWYDFFLRGMLADYDALRAAGRNVRLLIGPWGHGRGLYTRTGMRDALAALDAALSGGTPRTAGFHYWLPALDRAARLAPPAARQPGICIRRAGSAPLSLCRTCELVSLRPGGSNPVRWWYDGGMVRRSRGQSPPRSPTGRSELHQ